MTPEEPTPRAEDGRRVSALVDHLFRREAGRLVSILTRHFGVRHLHLAEDVVQDALVRAMQTWPFTGVPDNPSAWLLQTARNRALDLVRRGSLWAGKQEALVPLVEDCLQSALTSPPPVFEDEIRDSQLRMMFVCCQPGLPVEAQIALVLKTLCGFGEREIAAAFLSTEAAISKRLVRARAFLRESGITTDLPVAAELEPRVDAVLQALYLLYNEGYKASHGDRLLREELCDEAIRLAGLLSAHPLGNRPETHALLALMQLNSARMPARVDDDGALMLLDRQDRSRWDRERIRLGLGHLAASGRGDTITRYHLEAGLAACHCLAPDYASTDWPRILALYDHLLQLDPSPVVALNRAVAVARVHGPREGLRAIQAIEGRSALERYHLFHAIAGEFWLEAGNPEQAQACLRRALELATLPAERDLLLQKLARCEPS